MTSQRWNRVLAWAACTISALLFLCVVALLVLLASDSSYERKDVLLTGVPDLIMALAFAVVGAFISVKRPGNLVGWALTLAGVGILLAGVLGGYAELAVFAKPEAGLAGGEAAAAIASGAWTALIAGVFLLLAVFPSGRLPSARWRPVAAFVLICMPIIWLGVVTVPGELDPPFEAYENPLVLTHGDAYLWLVYILIVPSLVSVAAAAAGLILRFRRSQGIERQQYKWLAASAGLLIVILPIAGAFNWSGVAGAALSIALVALPVSVGVAVFRYRLYEIDQIVNRAVVYGAATALLSGLYFGIVIGLQAAFSGLTRGNDLAIAGSTLAVAALFRPVRRRIQAFVDRRFYRRRYDAAQTLGTFSTRLRDEIDLDELGSDLGAVVRETMQPTHLSLWIRPVMHTVTAPVTISGRSRDRKDSR